jgi:hypothetical protein
LKNVKIFRLFLVQFLIVGLFANSLLSQACFCGEACRHGPQGSAKASQSFPFHTRCSGSQCTSCNAEDVQTIKLSNSGHSTAKLKTLSTPRILSYLPDYQSKGIFIRFFFSCPDKWVEVQFPPRYLQHLSLLL